jgi:hypothetical protein
MPSAAMPIERLRPEHLAEHPIWRFTEGDTPDETWIVPLKGTRPTRLSGKIVGTQVHLADGSSVWALLGNLDPNDARMTQHFLTVSIYGANGWFHLARYHDVEVDTQGPTALAAYLGRALDQVFPLKYDVRAVLGGQGEALIGAVAAEPPERLTRAQVIALAVPRRKPNETR